MNTTLADNSRKLQLRRLHAVGRKHGLDHAALRDSCGVRSLGDLTASEIQTYADRLGNGVSRASRGPRLCNTPHADAHEQQRKAIYAKLKELHEDCDWPAAKCVGWLKRRYKIDSPWDKTLESGQASDILDALDKTLPKERARTKVTKREGDKVTR